MATVLSVAAFFDSAGIGLSYLLLGGLLDHFPTSSVLGGFILIFPAVSILMLVLFPEQQTNANP